MMNYFKNRNVLIWILVALLVINISAIGTILYHVYNRPDPGFRPEPDAEAPLFMKERMQLNDRQWDDFRQSHRKFRNASRELFSGMHENRKEMLEEIRRENPDKEKLYELADEYGRMHAKLKKRTVDHFLEMKKDITPEQERRMNIFLRNLMQHEGLGPPHHGDERERRKHRWRKNRQ